MYQKYTEGDNTFSYEVISGGSVKITGLTAKNRPVKEIRIPEEIDGMPVVWVGTLAAVNFSNLRDTNMHEAKGAAYLQTDSPGQLSMYRGDDESVNVPVKVYLPEGASFKGCGLEITSKGINVIKYETIYYERSKKSSVGTFTSGSVKYVYETEKFGVIIVSINAGNYPKKVSIPEKIDNLPVLAVSDNCITDRFDITETIEFPEGLSFVGNNCFRGLKNLHDVTFYNHMGVRIGENSFDLELKETATEDGGWSSSPLMPKHLNVNYMGSSPTYGKGSFVRKSNLLSAGDFENEAGTIIRTMDLPVYFNKIG